MIKQAKKLNKQVGNKDMTQIEPHPDTANI